MTDPKAFIAPISQPLNGRWYDLLPDTYDEVRFDLRMITDEVREETGCEELAMHDLAFEVGHAEALAWVEAIEMIGGLDMIAGDEWHRSFRNAYCGAQDSLEEWVWEDINSGRYGESLAELAYENPRYINIDAVKRDAELSAHEVHIERRNSVYRFIADSLTV